jgi:hypothetical protein
LVFINATAFQATNLKFFFISLKRFGKFTDSKFKTDPWYENRQFQETGIHPYIGSIHFIAGFIVSLPGVLRGRRQYQPLFSCQVFFCLSKAFS